MLEGMRGQLLSELLNRGLIASLHTASANAADAGLVRFVLVGVLRKPKHGPPSFQIVCMRTIALQQEGVINPLTCATLYLYVCLSSCQLCAGVRVLSPMGPPPQPQ